MRRDELKRKVCGWLGRGRIAAAGCLSMWAGTMGGRRLQRRLEGRLKVFGLSLKPTNQSPYNRRKS